MALVRDCYQVKLPVVLTEEEVCLQEKLGDSIFHITREGEETELSEFVLGVEFDKCNCTLATLCLYVELSEKVDELTPGETTVAETTSAETTVPICDVEFAPSKFTVSVKAGTHNKSLSTFVVYPLGQGVTASGTFSETFNYEITRVPCFDTSDAAQVPRKLRLVVPLTKSLQCLLPDFGLNGLLLSQTIQTELRAKVRLVSATPNKFSLPAVVSFDKERCTACLEFDADKNYDAMVKGYKHLYDCGNVQSEEVANKIMNPDSNPFEILSMFRRFEVRGVAKCTEKTLLAFDLCHVPLKPARVVDCNDVIELDDQRTGNSYRVILDEDEYCYEFSLPCDTEEEATTVAP